MSRAYLFIETGEVRPPKLGDIFLHDGENPTVADMNYYAMQSLILTRHEIEIPDKATRLTVIPERFIEGGCYGHSYDPTRIPIPRPKKKVKKWRWVKFLADNDLNEPVGTITGPSGHYSDSDDEIDRAHWRKIPETMIEVEE